MPIAPEKMNEELTEVCGKARGDIKTVLQRLGDKTIQIPTYSASSEELSLLCFGRIDVGRIKRTMTNAREFLEDHYRFEGTKRFIYIDLPLGNKQAGEARKKGRITLEFLDDPDGKRWAIDDPKPAESKVVQLWQAMIYAIQVHDIYLLYDAPAIVPEPRRHWSGSGEVEAAFLIGKCTALIEPHRKVHVLRWCDLGNQALDEDWKCFIILGSSIQNKRVQGIQTRERWEENQRFWFTRVKRKQIDTEGHIRGHIVDRSTLGGRPKDVTRFKYRNKSEEHLETDYALVTFIKDKNNRQTLIALQGITTFGTLAAARFMCSEESVGKLCKKLGIELSPLKKKIKSFEVVLEIPIEQCVPLEIALENIHVVSWVLHGENDF